MPDEEDFERQATAAVLATGAMVGRQSAWRKAATTWSFHSRSVAGSRDCAGLQCRDIRDSRDSRDKKNG